MATVGSPRPRGRRIAIATWAETFKSVADRTAAGLLLLVASPILGGVALITLVTDGRPVFFSQVRSGRRGVPFRLWKLRTMRVHDTPVAEVGQVTGSHPLVTPWGRVLRRTKLDELPQLWSVVSGEMSLVGPRPTIPEQILEYGDWESRRLSVRPGLTGWAQVNGNVSLSWAERIDLDIWYIDHWSVGLDLKILAQTVGTVIFGEAKDEQALEEAKSHAQRTGGGSREYERHLEVDDCGGSATSGGNDAPA